MRVYIDNFFLEGLLKPIAHDDIQKLPNWVLSGIVHDPQADALKRMRRLIEHVKKNCPPLKPRIVIGNGRHKPGLNWWSYGGNWIRR